jgi:hypothetical protein
MTTYSHTITLNDGERIMMEAALNLMMEHCDQKLSEDAGAPYWAHRQSAGTLLLKLMDTTPVLKSSNNFSDPSAAPTIYIRDSSDEEG